MRRVLRFLLECMFILMSIALMLNFGSILINIFVGLGFLCLIFKFYNPSKYFKIDSCVD